MPERRRANDGLACGALGCLAVPVAPIGYLESPWCP